MDPGLAQSASTALQSGWRSSKVGGAVKGKLAVGPGSGRGFIGWPGSTTHLFDPDGSGPGASGNPAPAYNVRARPLIRSRFAGPPSPPGEGCNGSSRGAGVGRTRGPPLQQTLACPQAGEHEVRPYGDKRLSRADTRSAPTTDARVPPCRRLLHFPPLRTHGKSGMMHFPWRPTWIPACAGMTALGIRTSHDVSFPRKRESRSRLGPCRSLPRFYRGVTSDWVRRVRRLGGARSAGVRQSSNECRKPA